MIWRKKVLLRANFSFFHSVQYRHRQHNIISPKIRESKTNFTNEITDDVIWRNIFGGINCVIFLSHCASKNVKFSLSENNFVNSTVCLVTSLVKMLLSRNFCQKSVRPLEIINRLKNISWNQFVLTKLWQFHGIFYDSFYSKTMQI